MQSQLAGQTLDPHVTAHAHVSESSGSSQVPRSQSPITRSAPSQPSQPRSGSRSPPDVALLIEQAMHADATDEQSQAMTRFVLDQAQRNERVGHSSLDYRLGAGTLAQALAIHLIDGQFTMHARSFQLGGSLTRDGLAFAQCLPCRRVRACPRSDSSGNA